MSSETPIAGEAAPSMPVVIGSTRPKFDGHEPAATSEIGFKRDVEPDDETSESTAVVPVGQSTDVVLAPDVEVARTKVLPHIEMDYSKSPPINYRRIDPNINLRSVQEEAIEAYVSETEKRRVIISLPTGCGKTITGLSIAGRVNGRVLWIAHRDELIEQPSEEIRRMFPEIVDDFGVEKASTRKGSGKRLVISSIQTLSRKNRLEPLLRGAPFSVVVYDECHHATSAQSMRVLSWLGCFREDGKGPRLLGLTATIERSDKTSLGHVFEDVVYSLPIQEAIRQGFLVPPKPIKVCLPINKKALRTVEGDYAASDLDRELARVDAATATAAAIMAHCKGRKTIVFCVSVDQSKRTAEACAKLGFRSAWASGLPYMNKTERKRTLKAFTDGKLDVLVSAELLCEGYDERSISAVVIARPTKSRARYVQQAGRGLRTCQHKTDCLLVDIVGASDLGFVTGDILLQKPKDKIKRKPRRRTEVPVDSSTEWKRIQSYLRSAKVDLIEHGELTFARASDDLIVTAAMDKQLVILRRAGESGADLWVIEHKGIIYTMEPLTLQEAMSVCDTLLPSFGGGAKPNSPEWDAATDGPTPPPGIMPNEATQIMDPAAQLPLAMKFVSGADTVDLAERVNNDIMNANSARFARGLRMAFEAKKCHLLSIDKNFPEDRHKWGWLDTPKARISLPPAASEACGPMVGWVYQDIICVDPGASVDIAREMLKESGEKDADIRTSLLRTHLGTINRTFKDVRRDWIKVKIDAVYPQVAAESK